MLIYADKTLIVTRAVFLATPLCGVDNDVLGPKHRGSRFSTNEVKAKNLPKAITKEIYSIFIPDNHRICIIATDLYNGERKVFESPFLLQGKKTILG